MAEIHMDIEEVQTLVSEISTLYDELSSKINELHGKENSISGFWSSKEATQFTEQLGKVCDMFVSFDKEYDNFILSLNNFAKMYGDEEDSIVSAINNLSPDD